MNRLLKSDHSNDGIMKDLPGSDLGNPTWQRDLSVGYSDVGDVQKAQRDLPAALKSYQKSLAIAQRLAKFEPRDLAWQDDLSVSYLKVGDIQQAEGDLNAALASYHASVTIAKRLASYGRGDWDFHLAGSYESVGDVEAAQGDLSAALKYYEASLAIAERLAKSDASNSLWQRGLTLAYDRVGEVDDRVGEVDAEQGNTRGAFKFYQAGLSIWQHVASLYYNDNSAKANLETEVQRLGNLAYYAVLARRFSTALQAADAAITVAPDEIWLYSNRADALMFLGRTREARVIYLKYRGTRIPQAGEKSWEGAILDDFNNFRKAGLTSPLMDEIEKDFSSAG